VVGRLLSHKGGRYMSENKKRARYKANGTVAGCVGLRKPIPPNVCRECEKHSDLTCQDIKRRRSSKHEY